MSRSAAPGRRATRGGRRLSAAAAVTALIPLLTLGASVAVRQHASPEPSRPPVSAPLDQLQRGCPASERPDSVVLVADGSGAGGRVSAGPVAGSSGAEVDVSGGRTASRVTGDPVVVRGQGEGAIGLVAARIDPRPLAAVPCPDPSPEVWFPGVGARYGHDSVVQIVNAESGPAVVDATVYAKGGILDVPEIQGVRVPGNTAVDLDLAALLPRHRDLGVRVVVSRGRASVTVRDTVRDSGRRVAYADWLAGQRVPATVNLVLGLPLSGARRALAIINPGNDEAQVALKVVTDQATFAPVGLDDLRVPANSLALVPLTGALGQKSAADAQGLVVTSSQPVVAAVRGVAPEDLVISPAAPAFSTLAAAVLPPGGGELILTTPEGAAEATISAIGADGTSLTEKTLRVSATRSVTVPLPDGTAVVTVRTDHALAGAVATTARKSATVVPLLELPVTQLIPQVDAATR